MTNDQQGRFFMNIYAIFLTLPLFLFSMNGLSLGAEVAKIGVIDFQRIIDESNAGKRSAVEIKSQGTKMEKILRDKEAELDEIKKSLEQGALAMSQEAREEKERAMRIRTNDIKSLRNRYLDVLKELNLKLSNRIREDVFELVEEMGRKEGYLLILERRVGGVVYAPNAIDITDKLIQEYNALDAKRLKEKVSQGGSENEQ
jgi:outer membrane protein